VARYKLGAALAEAAPYLLLLSATPHQGKTDQFLRLMQLIDRDSFPDEGSVSRDRVRPFVIRTEKRNAIDAEGQPLFKPRITRLQPVAWQSRHGAQQRLYEAVTDYVRHGYNQALAAKQRHIGFLMILMQRLVTSSTAAIRTTLEKRQALLNEPQPQMPLFDAPDMDEWAELDGQTQVDIAVQSSGWVQEKAEVDLLLTLARETEAQGTDAKAEALLELIYKLQQEENDPAMKVLIFTEFVPTQAMLAGFLESRGFSVALLNGSMDLDIVQDPLALRNLVADGIKGILQALPTLESSYRDWASLSRRLSEVIARFHALDTVRAEGLKVAIAELQAATDERLREWVAKHYADLPSLPVAKGPVMVHHVPRYLSMRRNAGESKVALLVFDGLALDQWVLIRETLARRAPEFGFDEGACFAWLPTLTSVSRQALFSGLKPREFADTIETTSPEPTQWSRFWQDQGLRANEVYYRKGIKRNDQLAELEAGLSGPSIKVAGIVVDTVDEIVHGAVLGKRGIASQIEGWCETGFVDRLFTLLIDKGFHVYLTADHGNVEAVGQGRPNQGVAPEIRGERVRTYRSETLVAESAAANPNTFRLDIAGLPANFMALFASGRAAFLPQGEPAVVHGGISVEELMVPFVKISHVS
jgi:hypothetical protein